MKTLVKWSCDNCRQGGDLVVDLPVNVNQLDELAHGEHRKSQSRRHCMCPHYGVTIDLPGALPHLPELRGKKSVVLYFENDAQCDEFIAIAKEAQPGLTARKL